MASHHKQHKTKGNFDETDVTVTPENEATAAMASGKFTSAPENAATTTAVLVTQRLMSKRKTPLTAPGYANSSITDTEVTSVLSTYASSRGNTNETNTMPRSGGLSPPAKQRRCGRTSDYVSTVDLFNQLL